MLAENLFSLICFVGLLTNYKALLADVSVARGKLKDLEEELEALSSSFNEASTKYKNCYKTP